MVSVCWDGRRVLAAVLVSTLTLLWTVWRLELGTPAWVPSVVTTTTTNNNNNNSVAKVGEATNTSDSFNIILEYLRSQDNEQGSRRNKVLLLSYSRQDCIIDRFYNSLSQYIP